MNKKKITSLVVGLAIGIQSFTPSIAAVVRKVDVKKIEDTLYVNKGSISHKESYDFENRLYIPLGDLARGLGMKTSFDGKKLYLNSQGKLDLDYTSKAYLSYQRGYEIQARERLIKEIENQIINMKTEKIIRDKNVIAIGTGDIEIYLDNRLLNLSVEPFSYNDEVYCTIDSISREFLITPEIYNSGINFDTNMILKNEFSTEASYEQLLVSRESELNILNIRLLEMEKKKKIIMDLGLTYEKIEDLEDMENYINRYFNKIQVGDTYISFDISLRELSSMRYELDIDIRREYKLQWKDLSPGQIQACVWDLYTLITTFLNEEAQIEGSIRNSGSSRRALVSFQSEYYNLAFSFIDSGLNMGQKLDSKYIEELLYEERHSIKSYSDFNFEVRVSGYDIELSIEDKRDTYLNYWSFKEKSEFLLSIESIISKVYPEYTIFGRIYNEEISVNFNLSEGIISQDFLVELEKILNDRYGTTSSQGKTIKLKYTLSGDKEFIKVSVYANISIKAAYWNETMKKDLMLMVGSGIDRLMAMTDKSILVKVYDENGLSIDEYGVYREQVLAPKSRPSASGDIEVLDTTLIELYTDTEGATIYFTTDGTAPTTNSSVYVKAFSLDKSTTINAIAVKSGMKSSDMVTFKYLVVDDLNAAYGLDSLIIENANLTEKFDRRIKNYDFYKEDGINSIKVTPVTSKGKIYVDDIEVASGVTHSINLSGKTTFTIRVSEAGKNDLIYSFRLTNKPGSQIEISLADYSFSSSIVGSFKGKVTGSIDDLSRIKVSLYSGDPGANGKELKRIAASRSGDFNISFEINTIDKIKGYYYLIECDGVRESGKLQ